MKPHFSMRAWWITLPVSLALMVWLVPAFHTIKSFVLVHPEPYTDTPMNSRNILLSEVATLTEKLRATLAERWHPSPGPDALQNYAIKVSNSALGSLEARLPSTKDRWVRGLAKFPGEEEYRKVRLRYRGDNLHHWGFPAKSWRVRLRKEEAVQGQRSFDFILPRWRAATGYYLPLRAAKYLNVASPEASFVTLDVNGRRHGGVHLMTEAIDEGFLRRHGRLPGDVYVGDMVLDDGLPREQASSLSLWALPGAWTKAAENNKFEVGSIAPLRELLTRLAYDRDAASHERLIAMLDLAAWARLSAWQKLMGATHLDEGHNWMLYYDYVEETIEPILRDGNALADDLLAVAGSAPGLDVSLTTPLLTALHHDQRFLRLKHQALADFFADQKHLELLADLEQVIPKVAEALQQSRQLDWLEMPDGKPLRYFTAEEFRQRAANYRSMLVSWFDRQREIVQLRPENVKMRRTAANRLLIEIAGYAPVAQLALPIAGAGHSTSACLRASAEGPCEALDGLVTHRDGMLIIQLPLFASFRTVPKSSTGSGSDLLAGAGTYEIVTDGAKFDPARPALAQGYRSAAFPIAIGVGLELHPADPAIERYGVVPVQPAATHWSGDVDLVRTETVEGDLLIAAGTRVRLSPGVNLFVRGRLIAEGTAEAPIMFNRADAARPWGTLAITGPRSDGSIIVHCQFQGGSGFKAAMQEYSGMVSIRNARQVRIEASTFKDNSDFDDMLHLAYSEVLMRDVTILSARSDAVDLDISTAFIDGLQTRASGNDGLDLMTSKVYLRNSEISGGGDKGVSVGEGSIMLIEDSSLTNNQIGIEAKDGSQVYAQNIVLSNNRLGVSGYHKNLRYPGAVQMVLDRFEADPPLLGDQVRLRDGSELLIAPGRRPAELKQIEAVRAKVETMKRELTPRVGAMQLP